MHGTLECNSCIQLMLQAIHEETQEPTHEESEKSGSESPAVEDVSSSGQKGKVSALF